MMSNADAIDRGERIESGDSRPIRRALLSVSDKTGLVDFAAALQGLGVEIISTGGTAKTLEDAGIPIAQIEEFTGFPEMLDGRVKTLHPKVHAGILHRRSDPGHVAAMEAHGLVPVDLVVVNLYPFEATVARPGTTRDEAVEQIDIGGPSMLRSAAKNHADVTVVCSPDRYEDVLREMRTHAGATTLELRKQLALEVFRRTAAYDTAIAGYFGKTDASADSLPEREGVSQLPGRFEISLPIAQRMRYGENPHQIAALYGSFLDHFEKLHGKELSYNNVFDLAAAQEMAEAVQAFGPAAVIVKHTNPCGVAVGPTLADAWSAALATDAQSASGGIIALSGEVDERVAEVVSSHFIEILVAPGFTLGALEILRRKKNRILLKLLRPLTGAGGYVYRSVPDGLLVQSPDVLDRVERSKLRVATRRSPTEEEWRALLFAWEIVRFVKSNAIVFTGPDRTLGIGAGQMSRVDSARIAALKAGNAGLSLAGSVVASDAFFPFPDGLLLAADAGATAAIQPGGSVRDQEVVEAADSRGMAMVFTGRRHFRH